MQLMSVTAKMTHYGWLTDRQRLREHIAVARDRVDRFTSIFLEATNLKREDLGPAGTGATQRVRRYFFEEMEAPPVSMKKRKVQFNTVTLIDWAGNGAPYSSAAASLLAIRKNQRLIDFCETYLQFSKDDGRIHFAFNPLGTQTGRWTSSTRMRLTQLGANGKIIRRKISCNAQQIPKREAEFDFGSGPEPLVSGLRDCFLADPGCVLLRADYDQLELRLIAYLYGVKRLIEALENGIDVHLLTASHLFREMGVTLQSDKSLPLIYNAREAAKTCAYAITYQVVERNKVGRYPTLFKALKQRFPTMQERFVEVLVQRFFKLYPEIRDGQQAVVELIGRTGYQELAINGRRLYYPDESNGYNGGSNFSFQGTGGVLADDAVLEIDPQLDWEAQCQIRGQVHDELILQAPLDRANEVRQVLEQAMSRPAQIGAVYAGIPAAADPGFDWGHCWEKFDWSNAPGVAA